MIVTATELANNSKSILDRVIHGGEVVEVRRHGRPVAEIRPKVGATREELLRILEQIHWTEAESRELKRATDAVSEVVSYAGHD
jgi:prevent-host-death family protein